MMTDLEKVRAVVTAHKLRAHLKETGMQAEIDLHLGATGEEFAVSRRTSILGKTHWISIESTQSGSKCELTVFGTPEQLDAFCDQVAQLRTKQREEVAA